MSAPVVVIDTIARRITVNDQTVEATNKEFALLALLASDPDRAFSKDELRDLIWPGLPTLTRTLDSHACRLRRRLAVAGADGVIRTIRGHGYRLGRTTRLVQPPQSPPPGTSGDAAAELLRLARETVARVRTLAGAEGDMATDLFAADAAAALKRASEIRVGRHRDRRLAAVA